MNEYKSAIVTGASSGIGAAIATQLCERNVKVYAIARNKHALNSVRTSLTRAKQKYFVPEVCDIANLKQVNSVLDDIATEGPVDLLVNNAGIGFSRDFLALTDERIDQVIATNLRGTINVTRAALRHRDAKRHLHIVAVTSLAGKMGFPQLSIYSATKFALEGLIESLRLEYDESEVTFTVLRPGITKTAFFDKAGMKLYQDSVKDLKSYYSPEKVASVFLSQLPKRKAVIIVGNDKLFLLLLPFVPFRSRFKILDIVNKI